MDAIFPAYISIWYNATKSPKWNPMVRKSISGKRRSLLFYESPIWEITLPIGHLYQWEMELVTGFFNLLSGPHDTFYFFDPMNKQENLLIGTGDGVETEFQLFRAWGFDDLYTEYPEYPDTYIDSYFGYGVDGYLTPDIHGFGIAVPPMPDIYLDEVLQSADYSITSSGLVVFDTSPATGVEITATFFFCYKVAFTDDIDPSIIFNNGWSTDLKIETVKS